MGATYTRQSTITDGAVIEASHFNDEFDQLLAAFAVSTGHSHDGTAAEGGPIAKLLSNTLTFGAGTAGTDITITFDGETSDGVMYWMEDEDHFKFADDVVIDSSKRLYLYDEGGEYIYGDGTDLHLVSGADINIPANIGLTFGDDGEKIEGDGTDLTISANNLNVDAAADINLDADGGDIFFKDGGTTFGSATYTSGNLIIKSGTTTALTFSGANVTLAGDLTISGDDLTMGTNTDTAIMVADGTNFNPVVPSGDVGLTNAGVFSIASNVIVNADINSSAAIADSKLATISTADKVAGGAIQIDSGTDGTSITLADTDKFLVDDGGTTKYINASQLNTYTSGSVAADNIGTGDSAVTIATSSGAITIDAQAGDADIIFKGTDSSSDITALTLDMSEAGAATFNDKIVATELDISGNIDIDGTTNLDNTDIDGTFAVDGTTISLDATTSLNIDNSNTSNGITIGTATSGVPISIGHSTSEVTINDNLTITGNFTVNGTTTTVNSTTTTVDDPVFTLGGDSAPGSDDNKDRGIEFRYHDGSAARLGFFGYDDSASAFTFLTAATNSSEVFSGTIGNVTAGVGTFASLDISGNIDIDGTSNLDAVDIDGAVQVDSTITVGADDQGYDVKFFGDTASAYMLWDTSADDLILGGGAGLIVPDGQFTLGSTAVASTAAELNIMDGGTAASSVTLADADRMVINDGGTMKQVAVTAMTTYIESNASFATKGFATAMSIAL